jgi:hypothetical protein
MQNDLENSLELVLDQLDQKLQSYVCFKKCIRTYCHPVDLLLGKLGNPYHRSNWVIIKGGPPILSAKKMDLPHPFDEPNVSLPNFPWSRNECQKDPKSAKICLKTRKIATHCKNWLKIR